MMQSFYPAPEVALEIQPAEFAISVLRHLQSLYQSEQNNSLIIGNYARSAEIDNYAGQYSTEEISRAIVEAWIWLEREGMIAPDPKNHCNSVYITKRGEQFLANGDANKYLKGKLIPEGALDPVLKSKVEHLFIRGDYDTAVFQAFKEVEVRVRKAAGLPSTSIGVPLMRAAFHPENGALTDMTQAIAEREATSALFAGAIGLFKNPSSHRDVNWEDAGECVELIYLSNYLLRLINRHQSRSIE